MQSPLICIKFYFLGFSIKTCYWDSIWNPVSLMIMLRQIQELLLIPYSFIKVEDGDGEQEAPFLSCFPLP